MQDALERLEFDQIRERLSHKCNAERAKRMADNLSMFETENQLADEKKNLDEMLSIVTMFSYPPINSSSDLSPIVELARKGGTLSINELDHVAEDILLEQRVLAFFKKVENASSLLDHIKNFPNLDFLEKEIHRVISPELTIFDNASPKLKSIRARMRRLESEMRRKLSSLLSESGEFLSGDSLTLRNGHFVLPVNVSFKSKVKGIIQDYSNSGETAFIEPEALVMMNNEMASLENEERNEIRRILSELSKDVATNAETIDRMNSMIAYIDFLAAKVRLGEEMEGSIAHLSDKDRTLELISARHPLLDAKKVVANDFFMSASRPMIVISGPNAGGKTVALKTLGIIVIMNQCGLMVPCNEGATIPYFKEIFVDIGDPQSIAENLSTFSGHMKNLGEIMAKIGGKDLALLDEVGTGTSPKEGEALAVAIAKELIKKHAFSMVSSHYEGLKAFALENNEATNASMLFDESNLMPTYKMKMGLPGESFGLSVARRYGLSDSIVKEAERLISESEDLSVKEAIDKLSAATIEAEKEKEKTLVLQEKLSILEEKLNKRESSLQKRESDYLSTVKEEKERLLEEYTRKLDDILDEVQGKEIKMHEVIKAKKKLEDTSEKEEEVHFNGDVSIGDYVEIPSLFTKGKVVSISGNKVQVVSKEGISFNVKKDAVVRTVQEVEEKKKEPVRYSVDSLGFGKSVPLEINLIGQRAEEAKTNLANYLDACLIKGYGRVRVIHGWGAGVLRKVVQDYCKEHPDIVKRIEGAGEAEGGGGATICYLK